MLKPLLAWCLGLSIIMASTAAAADITILPKPQQMEAGEGSYRLDAHTGIDAPEGARVQEIVAFLRESVHVQTGIQLSHNAHEHGIVLAFDPTVQGDEAYRLLVTPRGVVIQASSDRGLFWGVQTLRQLLPLEHASSVDIPVVNIEDAPSFAYRGFMLDAGRHFFPVSFIKKQLDLLSYYKINTFHWHLTEDQGWRIQIRRYPKLTEIGAWRTEEDGSRYGGFYKQSEIRDVIDYARERNITVIPEIEMPGHSMAALAAYPEYSCNRQPLTVPHTWGVFKDIYCVGNPETFTFLQHVLDETIALFPSPYVHIGGDETPKDRWKTCDTCQTLIREQNLKDEEGLQSYFIKRIQRYLESKNKILIGWDEILEGGADKNAIIEIWRGDDEARKALLNGNRIIVSGPFYLDSPLDKLTVENVYRTDIAGRTTPGKPGDDLVFAAHRDQILGGEAPLWTERVNPYNAESRIYPRVLALAENLWSNRHDDSDYDDFAQRLKAQYAWLDAQQVAYGPEAKPVVRYVANFDAAHHAWHVHAANGFDDLRNHCTTDGSVPTAQSPSFDKETDIAQTGTLKIVPFRKGARYDNPTVFKLVDNLVAGHPVTFAHPASQSYPSGKVLFDGILGSDDFHDGRWAAWHNSNMQATIDLEQPTAFQTIDAGFLFEPASWVLLPEQVTFATSDDGEHWTEVYSKTTPLDLSQTQHKQTYRFHADQPMTARYIRISATQPKSPPGGFPGGNEDVWLFSDEVLVQ